MYNFQGISPKALNLLAQNRYMDSKPFYEEHKEELKQTATVPLRKLMVDMSETLLDLDEEMYVNPVYSVSRIRRDTRYTKDKTLYRENLWVHFRRNKKIYPNCPSLWFEFWPGGYAYGLGFFPYKPAFMDSFRSLLDSDADAFLKALEPLEKIGMVFTGEQYKKNRAPQDAGKLKEFYNAKYICFIHNSNDLKKLNSEKIVDELKEMVKAAEPMYRFLFTAYDNVIKGEMENA